MGGIIDIASIKTAKIAMNSIYFYYYLWIVLVIIFLLVGIKLFTYKKKEGTRPFAIGLFIIGIITAISIVKSPSLNNRVLYFEKYSAISPQHIGNIKIIEIKFDKTRNLESQKEISQALLYLHDASPSYFSFGSGEVKGEYEIELKTNTEKNYFIRTKVYEKVVIIDLTIGSNKKFIGRYTNNSLSPLLFD